MASWNSKTPNSDTVSNDATTMLISEHIFTSFCHSRLLKAAKEFDRRISNVTNKTWMIIMLTSKSSGY